MSNPRTETLAADLALVAGARLSSDQRDALNRLFVAALPLGREQRETGTPETTSMMARDPGDGGHVLVRPRWRCACSGLNDGDSCARCGEPNPAIDTPAMIEARKKHAPPAPVDVEDRYPDAKEYEDFGASERFVTLVMAITQAAQRVTWEGQQDADGLCSTASVTALGNAEADMLTEIAKVERGREQRGTGTSPMDELEIDAALLSFQHACERAVTEGDSRLSANAKERAILRNALREKLLRASSSLGVEAESDEADDPKCAMQGPVGFICTEARGPHAEHIARGTDGQIFERWPAASLSSGSPTPEPLTCGSATPLSAILKGATKIGSIVYDDGAQTIEYRDALGSGTEEGGQPSEDALASISNEELSRAVRLFHEWDIKVREYRSTRANLLRVILADFVERRASRSGVPGVARSDGEDTARLDWLEDRIVEAQGRRFCIADEEAHGLVYIETWGAPDLRAIIDAAKRSPTCGAASRLDGEEKCGNCGQTRAAHDAGDVVAICGHFVKDWAKTFDERTGEE